MLKSTRPFVVGLLAGLLVLMFCSPEPRLAPTAQGACDNKCRGRNDFYFCGTGALNPCIYYLGTTCLLCVNNCLCDNSNGYSPLQPNCGNPANGPINLVYYYNNTCIASCDCTNIYASESTGGSVAGNPMTAAMPICIR